VIRVPILRACSLTRKLLSCRLVTLSATTISLCGIAFGNTVVVPNANTSVTANDKSGPIPTTPISIRAQTIVHPSQFPQGPISISRLSVRAAPGTGPLQVPITGNVYLSTSRTWPDASGNPMLSAAFADNVGPDNTLVFSGTTMIVSPGCAGSGPCPFSNDIAFTQPFIYDPADGPLLIDFQFTSYLEQATGQFDVMDCSASNCVENGVDAVPVGSSTGSIKFSGTVMQLTYTPYVYPVEARVTFQRWEQDPSGTIENGIFGPDRVVGSTTLSLNGITEDTFPSSTSRTFSYLTNSSPGFSNAPPFVSLTREVQMPSPFPASYYGTGEVNEGRTGDIRLLTTTQFLPSFIQPNVSTLNELSVVTALFRNQIIPVQGQNCPLAICTLWLDLAVGGTTGPGGLFGGYSEAEWGLWDAKLSHPISVFSQIPLQADASQIGTYNNTFRVGVLFAKDQTFNVSYGVLLGSAIRWTYDPFNSGGSNVAWADFAHTLKVTGVSMTDSNGKPVSKFRLRSAAGAVYTEKGVRAGEPPETEDEE
jgi:hypothetical protein